jgi:hypothetical protein
MIYFFFILTVIPELPETPAEKAEKSDTLASALMLKLNSNSETS